MKDFGLLQLAENEFGLELKTSHLQEKFGTFIANRNFTQIHEILRKLSIFYAILRKVSEIYSKFYANSRDFTQIIDILRNFTQSFGNLFEILRKFSES